MTFQIKVIKVIKVIQVIKVIFILLQHEILIKLISTFLHE